MFYKRRILIERKEKFKIGSICYLKEDARNIIGFPDEFDIEFKIAYILEEDVDYKIVLKSEETGDSDYFVNEDEIVLIK
jgi:hypothetical protein